MSLDIGRRVPTGIGFTPFEPTFTPPTQPTGLPGLPGTAQDVFNWLKGIGGNICPPGTRCVGVSVDGPFGISACIGPCVEMTGTEPAGNGGFEGTGIFPEVPTCPPGQHHEIQGGQVICVQTVVDGATWPPTGTTPQAPVMNGCACGAAVGAPKPCRCCLPGGGSGKTNKSGYYTYGRCGDPSRPTYHAPGTKCVKGRRSINPSNIRAGRRAVARVNAVHRELLKVENAIAKFAKSPRRRKK